MKIDYICNYCDNKFSIYSYSYDYSDDYCTKCNTKMTIQNLITDKQKDTFGYNYKTKEVIKGDVFGYEKKKK